MIILEPKNINKKSENIKFILKILRKHDSFVYLLLTYLILTFVADKEEINSFFKSEELFEQIYEFLNEIDKEEFFKFSLKEIFPREELLQVPYELRKEFFELISKVNEAINREEYYYLFETVKNEFLPKNKMRFGDKKIEVKLMKKIIPHFYGNCLNEAAVIINPGGGGILDAFLESKNLRILSDDKNSLIYSLTKLILLKKNFDYFLTNNYVEIIHNIEKTKHKLIYADLNFPSTNPYSYSARKKTNLFIDKITSIVREAGKESVLIVPAGFLSRESEIERSIREKIVESSILKFSMVLTYTTFSHYFPKPAILGLGKNMERKAYMLNLNLRNEKNFLESFDRSRLNFIITNYNKIKSSNFDFNPFAYMNYEKKFEFNEKDEERIKFLKNEIRKINEKIIKLKENLYKNKNN